MISNTTFHSQDGTLLPGMEQCWTGGPSMTHWALMELSLVLVPRLRGRPALIFTSLDNRTLVLHKGKLNYLL